MFAKMIMTDVLLDGGDSDQVDEQEMAVEVKAKDPCQMCGQHQHKYKCPKCLMATCSLACIKDHKS